VASGSGESPELAVLQFLLLFCVLVQALHSEFMSPCSRIRAREISAYDRSTDLENNGFPCSSSLLEIQEEFG
jgi:hypothetical protein